MNCGRKPVARKEQHPVKKRDWKKEKTQNPQKEKAVLKKRGEKIVPEREMARDR
jgi:hypothetical protein